MKRNKLKSDRPTGFTLLELLIAIALMDVIALTLYSSMYIGFRAKKNSQTILRPHQTVTPVFEIMREDFASILVPDGILAGVFEGSNVPWEDGQDADTLSVYTAGYFPSDAEIASNVIKVQYALDHDRIREQIVLKRYTTKNLLSPGTVEPTEEIICRGLSGFDVKYYDGTAWLDEWDSATNDAQLPLGVQVTLTMLDEESVGVRASRLGLDKRYRQFTRVFAFAVAGQDAQQEEDGEGTAGGMQ